MMKISWRYVGFFLALGLLFVLALLNPALFNTYLIEPVTRIVWLALRLFLMIDQSVYWTLLTFAAFTLFLRVVLGRQQNFRPMNHPDAPQPQDRVAYWQTLLLSAQDDAQARFALQQNLKNLRGSINRFTEENTREEITLPPMKKSYRDGQWIKAFLERISIRTGRQPFTDIEKSVDEILKSMETQLEIKNDRTANNSNDR